MTSSDGLFSGESVSLNVALLRVAGPSMSPRMGGGTTGKATPIPPRNK
jgi:hypothetical protein